MTNRPILFSAPMVRALLAGAKTQTRRTMPDQSLFRDGSLGPEIWCGFMGWQNISWAMENRGACGKGVLPRISVGDRLWVKETWAPLTSLTHNDPGPQAMIDGGFYRADDSTVEGEVSKWKPSIFMPRHASRITLKVNNVRVERLQDISEDDALAEGVVKVTNTFEYDIGSVDKEWFTVPGFDDPGTGISAVDMYSQLWNHINGDSAWQSNPWVVAYTFDVIKQNIDQIGGDA